MRINPHAALCRRYPHAASTNAWLIVQDGTTGEYKIAAWDTATLGPMPSEAEMMAWAEAEPLLAWRDQAQISRLDGKLALARAGLWDAFQAWATGASLSVEERIYFDDALTWRRTDPVLCAGAAALGLSDDQVDALFRAAGA
jgi:hypothetical protein